MYGIPYPIGFFDPPIVLDASVTNIPAIGGSPLQVVANVGFKAVYAIDYIDTTGQYIGVYYGPSGHEVLATIVGGGLSNRAWCVIPAQSRISLKSTTSTAISNGDICCIFMGL